MPAFNGTQDSLATAVYPGGQMAMWNNETVATGNVSAVLNRAPGAALDGPVTFTINWVSSPTATVVILASNTAPTASGFDPNAVTLATGTTQSWTATDGNYRFYQVKVTAYSGGGHLTAIGAR